MPSKKIVKDFIKNAKPSGYNPNMPDYSKDPAFLRKLKEDREFLEKVGLPENLKKKAKS